MQPERGSPAEWLDFAYGDLDLAREPHGPRVRREMVCFLAQQAAEKSIKAVLLAHRISFPFTHNLGVLLDLLPAAVTVPPEVDQAATLSAYAVLSRYPGMATPNDADTAEALRLAQSVVAWAEDVLQWSE